MCHRERERGGTCPVQRWEGLLIRRNVINQIHFIHSQTCLSLSLSLLRRRSRLAGPREEQELGRVMIGGGGLTGPLSLYHTAGPASHFFFFFFFLIQSKVHRVSWLMLTFSGYRLTLSVPSSVKDKGGKSRLRTKYTKHTVTVIDGSLSI